MFGKTTLSFTISKKAMRMVKNGEAVISSGGVRTLDGKMIEMVQPTVSSKSSKVLSTVTGAAGKVVKTAASAAGCVANAALSAVGSLLTGNINLVSSLAANVQCGFIQHGVNVANSKLDQLIEMVSPIADALSNLGTINVLSWVNSAFSVANMGVSIKGFKDTLTSIGNVQDSLNAFVERYKTDKANEIIERFGILRDNLIRTLDFLERFYDINGYTVADFKSRENAMEGILVETEHFIRHVMRDFMAENIDCRLGCDIIFNLTAILSQTMNAYLCQYYYAHGEACTKISVLDLLSEIKAPEFKAALREYMDDPAVFTEVSPVSLAAARRVAMESVNEQENRMNACAEIVKVLPREEFKYLDEKLNARLLEEIQPQIPQLNGASVEDYLAKCIDAGDYSENGDNIVLIL